MRKSYNRIVFSQFVKTGDEFNQDNTINDVAQKLKITSDEMKNRITAIPNHGTTDEILLSTLRG